MGQKAIEVFRSCIPLFQALSDPHRQDIVLLLAEHDKLTVNEITLSKLSKCAQMGAETIEMKKYFSWVFFVFGNKFEQITKKI